MELLSKDITLGFYNDTGIINLPISQYDAGRVISIGFTNDGKRFEIPESTSVLLRAIKPDGKQINTDKWCSIQDNQVVIEVSKQLSAVPGTVKCELVLGDATGKQYTSNRFNIIVGKPVHNNEHLISSDVYKDLTGIYLELDAIKEHSGHTDNPHTVTKEQVGLGNADNTADIDKPVSTAQLEALNLKADIASPILTGTPQAPTAPSGTNTRQIATTAYTQMELSDHNISLTSHGDIRNLISALATRVNALTDQEDTSDLEALFVKKTGDTIFGTLTSSKNTNSYLAGNQGHAIINSVATSGSYTMLDKLNSTNGYFTDGVYQNKRLLQYTTKATVNAGTNSVTKSVTLLDESGNSSFPGTVSATSFSGNATSATKATSDKNGKQIDTTYATKTEVNDLKKYVSDGKSAVANAITGKGITTAADAAFTTMAANIGKLKTTFRTQSKSVTPNEHVQTVYPDSGYDGLYAVSVGAAPNTSPPAGNKKILQNIVVGQYRSVFLKTYGKRIRISSSDSSAMSVASYWKCRYFSDYKDDSFYGITGGNTSNAISLDASSHTFIGSENYQFVSICRQTNSTSTIDLTIEWIPV
ncbi:MAG: hypothetical protein K2I53_05200 [Lachnospiraceae bacterium]|nr:hypothetical protein [Lachnospiraceae bacterium]